VSLKQLKPEYQRLWDTMQILPNRLAEATAIAKKIEFHRNRYQAVADVIGCPWTFIAVIHALEASLSFSAHLHNGDPLTRRTVQEPIGYPKEPPRNGWSAGYEWEESAVDALKLKKTHLAEDWSIAAQLWRLELYNGMGYRLYHPEVLSPYLWSGSNHYSKGKYVADGSFKANAVSAQIGAALLLKLLISAPTAPISFLSTPPITSTKEKGSDAVLVVTLAPGTYLKQSTEKQSRELPPSDIQWLDKDSELAVRWWEKVKGSTGDYYSCTLDGLNFKGKNTWYVFAKHVQLTPKQAIAAPTASISTPAAPAFATVKSTAITDRLVAYMQSKNYVLFTGEKEVNIIYLEGADTDGKPNADALNVWNDRRIVLLFKCDRPVIVLNVTATTEPGRHFTNNPMNPLGAARIQFNQFAAWRMGWHKNGHEALVQAAPVVVHRDFNKDGARTNDRLDAGIFHINQHHGGDSPLQDIGRWSAGCLVGQKVKEHASFIALCKQDPKYIKNRGFLFYTAVLPGDDFHKATYN